MIRSLNGVCLISVDEDILPKSLAQNLIFLSDSLYKLTSFKGKHLPYNFVDRSSGNENWGL